MKATDAESPARPLFSPEHIDEQRKRRSLNLFKEKGWSSGFDYTVCYLRYFKLRINLYADPVKIPFLFQRT
jgi:hypothetical protein